MIKYMTGAALAATALLIVMPFTANAASSDTTHDWNGLYAGGILGMSFAQFNHDNSKISPSGNDLSGDLGALVGYNYQVGSNVFGLEADGSYLGLNDDFLNFGTSHFSEDWQSTIRGRYGYALGAWLPYVTAGIALTDTTAKIDNVGSTSALTAGFAGGAGVDVSLGSNWAARAELLVSDVPRTDYTVGTTPMSLSSTDETFHIGVTYNFGNVF